MQPEFLTGSHPLALELAKALGVKDTEFLVGVTLKLKAGEQAILEVTNIKPIKIEDATKAYEILKQHPIFLGKDIGEVVSLMA